MFISVFGLICVNTCFELSKELSVSLTRILYIKFLTLVIYLTNILIDVSFFLGGWRGSGSLQCRSLPCSSYSHWFSNEFRKTELCQSLFRGEKRKACSLSKSWLHGAASQVPRTDCKGKWEHKQSWLIRREKWSNLFWLYRNCWMYFHLSFWNPLLHVHFQVFIYFFLPSFDPVFFPACHQKAKWCTDFREVLPKTWALIKR